MSRRADATHCVHAGEERHGRNAPLTTEIVQAAVFALSGFEELERYAAGKSQAYLYSRYDNPTVAAAERKLAELEGGEDAIATSSGMAASLCAVLATCRAGDELVTMLDIYGGTLSLFESVLPQLGISVRVVSYRDLDRLPRFLSRRTRLLWLESPTNPALRSVDLAGLAEAAHRRGALVAVDNTFATPILQKPLQLGADLVLHSATKYLGGHSDITAGALVGSRRLIARARQVRKLTGGTLDPGAAYLLLRGMKTLALRVERACANAGQIAQALECHPKVKRVLYPGLPQTEGHGFAARQMRDFGMMVTLELAGGRRAARRFIDSLQLWYLATSLGGVESTVSYPLLASHAGLSKERLKQMDVSAATVRLSVGIEDAADLLADLTQALERA